MRSSYNESALARAMAWRQTGNDPLNEPVNNQIHDAVWRLITMIS